VYFCKPTTHVSSRAKFASQISRRQQCHKTLIAVCTSSEISKQHLEVHYSRIASHTWIISRVKVWQIPVNSLHFVTLRHKPALCRIFHNNHYCICKRFHVTNKRALTPQEVSCRVRR